MGMTDKFRLTKKKKQAEEDKTGHMLYDLAEHISHVNSALGLQTADYREDEELSLAIERMNNQLTHIESTLLLGQYSPSGKIQKDFNDLKKERKRLQDTVLKMGDEAAALSAEIEKNKADLESLQGTVLNQRNHISELTLQLEKAAESEQNVRQQLEQAMADCGQAQTALHKKEEAYLHTLRQFISFRDQLFAQLAYLKAEHDTGAIKTAEGMLMVLRNVFEDAGIVVLDQVGKYDSSKQYISRTIPTDNIEQNMQIKETTKEGYLFEEKLIRQQEVAVYHYKQNI